MSKISITANVKRIAEGVYRVPSGSDMAMSYTVDLNANTCQCPHFHYRMRGQAAGECKHIETARARCAEVTALKARRIPDVRIDELAAQYESSRPEIAAVLYDEIRRRGTEELRNAAALAIFACGKM